MYDPLKAKARVIFATGTAFLMGLGIASGLGWTSISHAMPAISDQPQVPESAVRPAMDLSDAFTNLAEAVTPAVVRIESRRTVAARNGGDDLGLSGSEGRESKNGGEKFLCAGHWLAFLLARWPDFFTWPRRGQGQ